MTTYQITKPEKSSEITKAAVFFSQKWNIPPEAYIESIKDSLVSKSGVPAWFYIEQQNEIIAGLGIIENDFHKRRDLTPNICAVYVREDFQGKGIAKSLLNAACSHLSKHNISDVYLITTHTEFYEHCGFHCVRLMFPCGNISVVHCVNFPHNSHIGYRFRPGSFYELSVSYAWYLTDVKYFVRSLCELTMSASRSRFSFLRKYRRRRRKYDSLLSQANKIFLISCMKKSQMTFA